MYQLYAAIWRVSGRRQTVLIALSVAVAALAAVPLGFQKEIINGLTDSDVDRSRLFLLCGGMIGMILVSLSLKWVLGYRASILGEDVIRMLRTRIYGNAIKAGPDRQAQAGTLATMISAEAEELGNFTGSAFSEPVVQIGTLVSVIGFIASTQPFLGGIALLMIVPQVILVLSTQGHVNRLVGQRVRVLRHATDNGVATDFEKFDQGVVDEFNKIFDTRRRIFLWKLSTKFLLSAINGAGMVGVLALGGAFVISGKTDVGTVVAATIGLGRLQGPTGFLIAFYRQVSATRVKYELLRDSTVLPQNRV
ncbi:MAG: ABC transporter transmembrane domain-containing protein [Paracoccaceae bacterium]